MFTNADFTLHFSMPLDRTDWQNLEVSKVQQVMIPWGLADESTLSRLTEKGCKVVLRMDNDTVKQDVGTLYGFLSSRMQYANIRAVLLGNEPELSFKWTWGANWGTEHAWPHAYNIQRLCGALRHIGPQLISPAWSQREFVETDPPIPGLASWREICGEAYNNCDGNGVHLYGFGWWDFAQISRFQQQMRMWLTLRHRPLWIDEYNIAGGDQVTRMRACLDTARLLRDNPAQPANPTPYPLGDRVAMFSPFISNGLGNAYPPEYVMRDPACYALVRTFMEE